MTEAVDKWDKLEQIVRKVMREELAALGLKSKSKVGFSNGKWTGVNEEHMAAWAEAYPGVNIEAELRRASAWIVSNPTSAPKSNFARYLNSWLAREQNKAAFRSIPLDKRQWAGDQEVPACSYCEQKATGTVNGIRHCRTHMHDAMDGKKAA